MLAGAELELGIGVRDDAGAVVHMGAASAHVLASGPAGAGAPRVPRRAAGGALGRSKMGWLVRHLSFWVGQDHEVTSTSTCRSCQ